VKLAVAAVSDGSRMLGCRLRSGWRIRPVKLPTRPASKTGDLLFREELMVRIHLPPALQRGVRNELRESHYMMVDTVEAPTRRPWCSI
jgi:hypothetical protein